MNNNWTKEETIVAFNVYCKIPFKDSNKNHPMIIEYAKIIGRSPSALNMKVGNLGRLDPKLKEKGIVGLSHGSKIERIVWEEFYANPEQFAYESECLIAKYANKSIEKSSKIDINDLPNGKERETIVKLRVNQSFFRSAVMTSYNNRCCVSGVGNPQLLEACHIVSWADDSHNRTNPENGLCLNSLFHRAYDKHLMAITPDYEIIISENFMEKVEDSTFEKYLKEINGRKINMPTRFYPQRELLDIHYQKYLAI